MTIQYASDLHLEFRDNTRHLKENPLTPLGEILVLAGDISILGDKNLLSHPLWDWLSKNYKYVLVVPGNHEFYNGFPLDSLSMGHAETIRENISWFYNKVVTIEDIEFIITPLWSFIEPQFSYWIERAISDFKCIHAEGKLLKSERFNLEYAHCLDFLSRVLEEYSSHKRVVVTHHLPTKLCMAEVYKNSVLNGAFVSELYDLIHDNRIDYWIYGHSHKNMPEIEINGTKLICNQLGYVHQNEHLDFRNDAIFKL